MGMQDISAAGMFVRDSQARVPLSGVKIEVDGGGAAARVTVRQQFINLEKSPIEAVYSFPLVEGSAVCELIVETGGRRLLGQIAEREAAFEQYDDAMADGNGAFLADQDRPDIFTMSVGNLLPGQQATVSLSYVSELEQQAGNVRLMLPTTISPRYVPQSMLGSADPAELDRINPPTACGRLPYGLSLSVDYHAPQGVKSVACPSHPAEVRIGDDRVRVELMGAEVQLDRDFVLNIALARPYDACAVLGRDGDTAHALMINLYPDLGSANRAPGEFIFILDRSGSMNGDNISQALNALRLALRSLQEGDAFNVIGFGSRHERVFAHSRPYTQAALDEAGTALDRWDANLGGTELLAPLREVLQQTPGTLARRVFLLTDGQVGNEAECIALAGAHAESTRIFTFGIGHGASQHLLSGLARAGRGRAEFIHPNERIEPVVMRQLARAAAPLLRNVRMDWGGLRTDLVTPRQIPTLFDGERLTVYARVTRPPRSASVEVAVLADGPDGALRFPVTVDFATPAGLATVPLLMARSAIRELEEGRDEAVQFGSNQRGRKHYGVAKRVLELALRYGILSSQTSFVAIEERVEGTQSERAVLRRVPVSLTRGWGGESRAMAATAEARQELPSFLRKNTDSVLVAGCMASMRPGNRLSSRIASHAAPPVAGIKRVVGRLLGKSARDDRLQAFCRSVSLEPESARMARDAVDSCLLLAMSQQADGSFRLPAEAIEVFGLDQELLERTSRELGGGAAARAVLDTALSVALLQRHFGDRHDELRMIIDKALRWLDRQTLERPREHMSWVEWAAALCQI